ncbi:GTPase IMAP family member GIMD1-like [Betta splendens]|uniref:GTPase IMAP family member GIMD1-like n=1 Tax=Betta splendens TaxID=158456 RepID=A0A6P7KY85_BETSP|nr:GTPase IMAP family member GIMD1-like [Betta splendens]
MDLSPEHGRHGNKPVNILSRWIPVDSDARDELVLNVLLLGDRQSGRSSVGNALIGGHEFQTGRRIFGDCVTAEYQVRTRRYSRYFRRQGAECDLVLRVVDTPPLLPHPQSVDTLCPEGVHVLVLVVRADLTQGTGPLGRQVERLFGPGWRRHALLVLTYADLVQEAGLDPSSYLTQAADWLRTLAGEVTGGVLFMDDSCDWPSIRGEPLRARVLDLSARNHHTALRVPLDPTSSTRSPSAIS